MNLVKPGEEKRAEKAVVEQLKKTESPTVIKDLVRPYSNEQLQADLKTAEEKFEGSKKDRMAQLIYAGENLKAFYPQGPLCPGSL